MSIRIADVEQHKVQTGETLATIANGNGLTTDQLTKFNWNTTDPKEINRCLREIVGCTKRTNDGKNYILDSSDNPGLLYIPKPLQLPGLALNKDHVLRVRRPRLFGRITIQTVDYYGHPRPDFSLRLEPLGKGRPLTVKTDSRGVWTTAEIDSGRYEVLESDGQPAYYYEELNRRDGAQPESPFGELKPAVFTTRVDTHTIITVVVGQEPPYEARQEVQRKADAYTRNETRDESAGRGSETAGLTRRSAQTCADNLLLAAGLTRAGDAINWAALAGDILPGYFDTYYPSVSAQGFYVAIFDADERLLRLFNSSGVEETRLELNPDKELACLYGSYAVFQNESGPYFVDLATRSFMIKILNNDTDLGVESLVRDPSLYTEYTNRNTGKVEIVVVAPELKYMDDIAMQGGTGALENYGDNAEINEKIHQRNLGVCREIRLVYEAYIRGYVDRVNEAASESELRELGPPFNIYEMPSPAGWTKSQLVDIFNALNTNAELDAWVAIAHKLDAFGNRLSQGLPFFRLKVKWKKDLTAGINDELTRNTLPALPKFVKVDGEVEFNLDLQSTSAGFRKIVKHDEVLKVSGKFEDVADEDVGKWNPRNAIRKVTKNGFVLEANFQQSLQNPEKRAVALRVDDYSFQIDSTGKTKLSTQSAPGVWIDTEFNNRTGEMGVGGTFKFKDIAKALRQKAENLPPPDAARAEQLRSWADYLEAVEISFLVGFVGTREETVLATVSGSPGFFERRSIEDLFRPETQWNDLTFDEQNNLAVLGWWQDSWNLKYREDLADELPASLEKVRSEMSPAERMALVHLGFFAYEDYAKSFKKYKEKHQGYVH